jgi:hypothetical protein
MTKKEIFVPTIEMIVEIQTKKMNLGQNDQRNIHQEEILNHKNDMGQRNIIASLGETIMMEIGLKIVEDLEEGEDSIY